MVAGKEPTTSRSLGNHDNSLTTVVALRNASALKNLPKLASS